MAVLGDLGQGRIAPGFGDFGELRLVRIRHGLFHVHVGGALIFGTLGHLRHGLDLVQQPSQENLAHRAARNLEIAPGLDPNLRGRGGGDIVAQSGGEESGRLGDGEFSMIAETVQRRGDLLALRQRQGAVAQPHHHALDARVPRRVVKRQHDVHHRLPGTGQRQAGNRRIRDRPAQIQSQHHGAGKTVAPGQSDHQQDRENQDQQKGEFGNAVQHRRHDRAEPTQESGHGKDPCTAGCWLYRGPAWQDSLE